MIKVNCDSLFAEYCSADCCHAKCLFCWVSFYDESVW